MKIFILSFFFVLLFVCTRSYAELEKQPLLKGVTAKNWPFLAKKNGTFKGFLVDLIDKISEKVGFKYQLQFTNDGAYNSDDHNYKLFKIVSDVFKNRADFALADLTITDARKRYVDFTEPFMEYQMAALIRKDHAAGLLTLQDLVDYNFSSNATKPVKIAYGTIHSRATIYNVSRSKDPTAMHLYNWMEEHPEAYLEDRKVGLEKVQNGQFAFLVESSYADYVAGGKCNVVVLRDSKSMYRRHFAIALSRGSQYLAQFNRAIRELTENGEIQRTRQLYWTNKCN